MTNSLNLLGRIRTARGFGWKVRKSFYRHLAVQGANGVPLERALESYLPRLRRSRQNHTASVVATVARRFRDGKALADALQGYVAADEVAVIRSGELGGSLSESLELIIQTTDSIRRVQSAIRRAAFAPAIYLASTFALIWMMGRFIFPDLQLVLPMQRAQGTIAMLYTLGDIATSYWAVLPPVIALGVAAWVYWALPNWISPLRIKVERFFPFSFYRDTSGFRWLMSFTSLLGAGVPDVEILKMQIRGASPWLGQRLRACHRVMINGKSLSEALLAKAKGHPPYGFPNPDIADDIASFDGFPDFNTNIQSLAREWARDLEERTLLWASRMGFYCEMALYGVMGLLMVAINDLSSQLSHVTGM